MRIKSIEAENHESLGTFKFDFDDDKNTTLLIGKNGSGKTRLIEEFYKIFDSGLRLWTDASYKKSKTVTKVEIQFSKDECIQLGITTGHLLFIIDCSDIPNTNGWQTLTVRNADDNADLTKDLLPKLHLEQTENGFFKLFRQKMRYSSVLINFEYQPVTAFAEKVDDNEKIQTKSTASISDEINKLLVSTFHSDKTIATKEYESGTRDPVNNPYKGDFDRFRDAYNKMFVNREILGVEVEDGDNKIKILNKDTDKTFGIDGLSSGEQQVVYRVGYLLKNLGIKSGGVVLIDEPELSLHPEWQIGYLQFLQDVFGGNIQFIIATHSPYLAKSASALGNVAISQLYTEDRNLNYEPLDKTTKLGQASYAEVSYKVFKVSAEEYHRELYLAMTAKLQVGEMPSQIDKYLMQNPAIPTITTPYGTETLVSFVRNIYHHGNDAVTKRGRDYTSQELENSILEMEKIL